MSYVFRETKEGGIHILFEDMGTVLSFANMPTTMKGEKLKAQASRRKGSDDKWAGTSSWEEAMKLAKYGWVNCPKNPMLTEYIETKLSKKIDFETYYDVAGSDVDVGLFLAGEPECMIEFKDTMRDFGKIIDIQVEVSFSAYVNPQHIINRGAAIIGVVNALENSGFRINLVVTETTEGYSARDKAIFELKVKDSAEILDENKLQFIVAHPSMLRRIIFGVQERYPLKWVEAYGYYESSGYGVPATYHKPNYHIIPSMGSGGGASNNFHSPESAYRWAEKEIKKIMAREKVEVDAA